MKQYILNRYNQLLNKKEVNSKYVLAVLQEDEIRTNKALKEIYRLFYDEIESDFIENILYLTVAYIVEEQI